MTEMSVQSNNSLDAGTLVRDAASSRPSAARFRRSLLRPVTALVATRIRAAGNRARDQKRWPDAIRAYVKYLRLRPDSAPIWVQYGHCLKEGGNAAEAEKAYLKALELGPDSPDTLLHLGRIKLALNDPAAAASYLERAASFHSPSLTAARELQELRSRPADDVLWAADKARDEKRWAEAIEGYEAFLRLKPLAANIWVQLGHCLRERGNAAEAEKAYLKALQLGLDNPDTLLHVGRIKLALNDPAAAASYLERAASFDSPSLSAARELQDLRSRPAAELLLGADKARDERRWAEAIEAYHTYLDLRPEAARIWVQLGHCLKESGSAEEAERAYLKALELDPDNADTLLHLGRVKRLLNDTAEADQYLRRAAAVPSPSLDAAMELWDLQLRPAELERLASALACSTNASSQPNGSAVAIALRNVPNLQANSKLLGAYVAELIYNPQILTDAVDQPQRIGTKGRVCKQSDFSSSWFLYWTNRLKLAPRLHRKIWEDAYTVQCLWERGCLRPGMRGLGFAVGTESLPSLFAGCGASITATDLSDDDPRSHGWRLTNQHASNLEALWKPPLVDRETFFSNCSFEFVDMTRIPSKFNSQFDFCWSVCSLEHLGTLQNGLEFVRGAVRTLKPGGVAVHTTEYNVGDGDTIDNWATVLYQRKHFATLRDMIEDAGCRLVDIDFDVGSEFFDYYVDVPPYPHQAPSLPYPDPPHVKVSVDGFSTTSIAIIVEKPP